MGGLAFEGAHAAVDDSAQDMSHLVVRVVSEGAVQCHIGERPVSRLPSDAGQQ
jgi:hypothetical protein